MGFHYVVLGAGRQGIALAYDLALNCEAERVTLADVNVEIVRKAVERVQDLLPDSSCRFVAAICDVSKPAEVAMTVSGADVVVSAVPYRFNVALTDAAIAACASFCDLGGNTQVAQHQLQRHARAVEAGVSVLPDCGLAPGLGNILAAHGIAAMDEPEHAHVRCGGLPEKPVGPLGYKLCFAFEGLINEYSGFGEFLRDGRPLQVPALTELETIEFPAPLGVCEAAVTSGGTSTCAATFSGRVKSFDYKTVRYPGHFAIVRAMFELGCFDEYVRLNNGEMVEPRPLLRSLMEDRLAFPGVHDLVVLRCTVSGRNNHQPCTRTYNLFDRHDEATGFTAMERTTAFPAALCAYMQAQKLVKPGARPLEVAIPMEQYLEELPAHGINIETATT